MEKVMKIEIDKDCKWPVLICIDEYAYAPQAGLCQGRVRVWEATSHNILWHPTVWRGVEEIIVGA